MSRKRNGSSRVTIEEQRYQDYKKLQTSTWSKANQNDVRHRIRTSKLEENGKGVMNEMLKRNILFCSDDGLLLAQTVRMQPKFAENY